MKNFKDTVTIGTTFNKRIYESEYQQIFADMKDNWPETNFFVYHENSFEREKFGQEIDFSQEIRDNLYLYDVFDVNDWMSDFIKTSPLKDCHKIGEPGCVPSHDDSPYWRRNAIYWFRKIAAIKHCIEHCKTPYLVWLGADTFFRTDKGYPNGLDQQFFDYVSQFDCSVVKRPGQSLETDIVIFNFNKKGKQVAQEWIEYFLSGKTFNERRWDDAYILTKVMEQTENKKYSFGGLRYEAPFNVYRYIRHYKGPLLEIRDKKKGI